MATTSNPFEINQPAAIAPVTNQPSPAAPAITQVAQATPTAIGDVSRADSTGYAAKNVNVTPDQTVEGRVEGIIAKNSPLMQQAESRAMQQANSRGLINSSIAATAGQSAVLDAATNIGRQDAQTFANAESQNAQSANAASQFGSAAKNTASLTNAAADNAAATNNAKFANDAEMSNTDAINKATTANLGAASNQHLAGIEAQYKQLTQGSASAASIMNTAQQSINAIIANTNLDAAAKDKAVTDIRTNLQNSMSMIGALAGDVDLGSYINQIIP